MNNFYWILLIVGALFFGIGWSKKNTKEDHLRLLLITASIVTSFFFMVYILKCFSTHTIAVAGQSFDYPFDYRLKSFYHSPIIFLFIIEYFLINFIPVTIIAWLKEDYHELTNIYISVIGLVLWLIPGILGGISENSLLYFITPSALTFIFCFVKFIEKY